jgi:hypothetical protein
MRASERPWFNLEAAVSGERSTVRGETIHGNAKIANSSANISWPPVKGARRKKFEFSKSETWNCQLDRDFWWERDREIGHATFVWFRGDSIWRDFSRQDWQNTLQFGFELCYREVLSLYLSLIKSPEQRWLFLRSQPDNIGVRPPFPPESWLGNCLWGILRAQREEGDFKL